MDNASLLDIGDGVLLLEKHTKMNVLTQDVTALMELAVEIIPKNGYTGLVIGNQGDNFCAGANVLVMAMAAQSGMFDAIDAEMIRFQTAVRALRYAPFPIVTAPFNMTLGGGVEMALFSWASNNNAYGPSHGRFFAGAAILGNLDGGDLARRAVYYRFGGVVSFEGNASRRFLIPHFSAALGGLWEAHLRNNTLLDASIGAFLVHTRRFVLDAEGGVVFPFSAVDELFGPRVQLTASFALW